MSCLNGQVEKNYFLVNENNVLLNGRVEKIISQSRSGKSEGKAYPISPSPKAL